jgi:hypothetical protein
MAEDFGTSSKGKPRFGIPSADREAGRTSIEGVVTWRRSQSGREDCICCDGPHVYSRYVALPDDIGVSFDGTKMSLSDWVGFATRAMPEGVTVRVTMEVVQE